MLDGDFASLVTRARTGDEAAVRSLLQSFEDEVRLMVRVRLPRALRSQFDSMDFVQAVWKSVLIPGAAEPVVFANAEQFRGYLAGVARNKVLQEYRRRTQTRKYDLGREEPLYVRQGGRDEPREVVAPDPTPSQEVQALDRWEQLVRGRSPVETQAAELRRQGLTFEEIGQRLGLSERSVRRIIDAMRQRLEERP
jgi:RNA polymerase sigma factor (sigma-70 family)